MEYQTEGKQNILNQEEFTYRKVQLEGLTFKNSLWTNLHLWKALNQSIHYKMSEKG